MCFNATTSLVTFSISLICFGYLLYYGIKKNNNSDVVASIIVILIGLMQLIEYFLWKNQDCSLNKNNHVCSLMIMVLLALQPIVGCLTYKFLFKGASMILNNIIFFLCFIYVIFTVYLVYFLNKTRLCSKPSKKSCRLVWAPFKELTRLIKSDKLDFSSNNLYKFILFEIFFAFYFVLLGYGLYDMVLKGKFWEGYIKYPIRYSILPVTYLYSLIYSYYKEGRNWVDIYGSFWCFNAVAFGVISCLHI
jgi:hypothetical protein